MHKTAVVFPTAYLGAPCIIGPETEVRHWAFIRGSALVGAHCVVGNSVELKNVILFDNVQTPHYNYVGDSILGYKSHMGAGSITSNVKSDKTLVTVKNGAERIETGRKKFGAILGDFVEVGCNSVLNPGTVVGGLIFFQNDGRSIHIDLQESFSAISNVRRSSMGRTIRPSSSTFRTMPVDFNVIIPFFLLHVPVVKTIDAVSS